MCRFLPVYHLGIAFLGWVEGQNITIYWWVRTYVSWLADTYMGINDYNQKCVSALCLNTSRSVLFAFQTPTILWRQNPINICTSLHNPNLLLRWKHSKSLLSKSNSSFPFPFYTWVAINKAQTIFPVLSAYSWLSTLASFEIQQHRLTSLYGVTAVSSNN